MLFLISGVFGEPGTVPELEREGGDRLPVGEEHRDRAEERTPTSRREAQVEGERVAGPLAWIR